MTKKIIWRLPTVEDWKELFTECSISLEKRGYTSFVVFEKNGNFLKIEVPGESNFSSASDVMFSFWCEGGNNIVRTNYENFIHLNTISLDKLFYKFEPEKYKNKWSCGVMMVNDIKGVDLNLSSGLKWSYQIAFNPQYVEGSLLRSLFSFGEVQNFLSSLTAKSKDDTTDTLIELDTSSWEKGDLLTLSDGTLGIFLSVDTKTEEIKVKSKAYDSGIYFNKYGQSKIILENGENLCIVGLNDGWEARSLISVDRVERVAYNIMKYNSKQNIEIKPYKNMASKLLEKTHLTDRQKILLDMCSKCKLSETCIDKCPPYEYIKRK